LSVVEAREGSLTRILKASYILVLNMPTLPTGELKAFFRRSGSAKVRDTMIRMEKQQQGLPSLADLPSPVISSILSLLQSATDRNHASEVCRCFRFYERQTRRSLSVRALQRHLSLVPLCFSSVSDLDLSSLTLFNDELPGFKFEKSHQLRLARAFPNVKCLKVMAMNDDSIREIGLIWPRLGSISFKQQNGVTSAPHLKTLLDTFKYCEEVDARNIQCSSLAAALSGRDRDSPLKTLNLEALVLTSDKDLDVLAEKCSNLETLCITVHPGLVTGDCFLKLADRCRKLRKLRLFLYLDSLVFNLENARNCLYLLARMTSELPDIELHISLQHIPTTVTGNRMECLVGMASCIRSLVLYSTEADVKGIWSCSDLTELTFGACDGVGDLELVSVVKKCPKLHTLRILDCKRITQRGLREVANIAKLTSLSLCFLKVPVNAQVDAVKPMSGTLRALRLMANGPVDSLSGLSGWPHLDRLEVTFTSSVPEEKLSDQWLDSCPNLRHLGLLFHWCPSTLRFLLNLRSLPSLSLSFQKKVKKEILLSFLEYISLLPQLTSLTLFIWNEEWLCKEAGTLLARCPKLKSLNIVWNVGAPALNLQLNIRPFLLKLLTMRCLQNVQLPPCMTEDSDLKIFHQGLHAHTMHSILRSIYDLQAQDSKSSGRKNTVFHLRRSPVF
jgi:hypothetical protein